MNEQEEVKIESPTEESILEDVFGLNEDTAEAEEAPEKEVERQEKPILKLDEDLKKDGLIDKKINRRVDARVERLERQLEKKIIAEREAYIGAIATVQERLDAAIESNNIKEVKQAEKALETLTAKKDELEDDLKVIKEEPKDIEEAPERPEIKLDDSANRWIQANKKLVERIDSDPALSAIAKGISAKLLKNGYKDRPQIDLLAEVKRRILEENPEDFSDIIIQKDQIPTVSGGKMDTTVNGGAPKKTYTMKDVPARDAQILRNYVTAGIYKDEAAALTSYFKHKGKEGK